MFTGKFYILSKYGILVHNTKWVGTNGRKINSSLKHFRYLPTMEIHGA